jgi:hypothetical protein
VFMRLPVSAYPYAGEVIDPTGHLRLEHTLAGAVLVEGSALSADITHLVRYRLAADTLAQVAEQDTSDGSGPARRADLESCRMPDYRRDPLHCWHPGWPSH